MAEDSSWEREWLQRDMRKPFRTDGNGLYRDYGADYKAVPICQNLRNCTRKNQEILLYINVNTTPPQIVKKKKSGKVKENNRVQK